MKNPSRWTWLIRFVLLAGLLLGQNPVRTIAAGGGQAVSVDGLWQALDAIPGAVVQLQRPHLAGLYAFVRLNKPVLDELLARAPLEDDVAPPVRGTVITLPLPNGRFNRFLVEESPILAPELAAAFPELRTYRAKGLDDPTATARLDWTQDGFHAAVISAGGTVYIDPFSESDLETYVSYDTAALQRPGTGFICLLGGGDDIASSSSNALPISYGATKRTYRLALAVTGEYTAQAGGTKSAALARMTTTMNRVNGIYERDLAVHLTMAAGTPADPTALIYTDPFTDPYTNSTPSTMLAENQSNLDAVVGTANYDVGHVFAVENFGGTAALRSVCSASSKGAGVSGNISASGDYFDVNTLAHEFGHQFGANHTYNGTSGSCTSRSASHAFEPASGSTPMGYNFVCGEESLQVFASDYFHVESLNEITSFLTSGGGQSCGIASAGNTVPTVNAPGNFIVPQGTPFTLTASGSDADGDALTYTWEQYNLGAPSSSAATASTDDGTRPLFRSYPPTPSPSRTFPSLPYILNNANVPPQTYSCLGATCLTGEVLPSTNRTLTFQVTARDNHVGGGAVATASTQITSTTTAGPFAVTFPNSVVNMTGQTIQTVTWNVANTSAAPVSTTKVKISLSTDGGQSFPIMLATGAPNTGSAAVFLPNVSTLTARIKVEAVGNIFFDISNTNFAIAPGAGAVLTSVSPTTAPQRRAALDAVLTGQSTHFVQGLTTASFGPGITVNRITVTDETHATANVTIAGNAAPGTRTVAVTTAGEVAALNSAFTVTEARLSTSDFDGDGKTDITVFRPSTGVWHTTRSSTGTPTAFAWGNSADKPVVGDFDGDGRTDIAVFRPSNGTWYIVPSTTGVAYGYAWGNSADITVPGDYDGDGKTDIAVFRPSNGTWYVVPSTGAAPYGFAWGNSADRPTQADYDGDGKTDIAVFRPSNGTWYVVPSTGAAPYGFAWGNSADRPVAADYDGDGKTDIAVFRPSNGTWYVVPSTTGVPYGYAWGNSADITVPADYDGDGRTDIAVFRPSTGTWFIVPSTGAAPYGFAWGNGADLPILKRP